MELNNIQEGTNLYVLVFSKREIIKYCGGWIPTPHRVQYISPDEQKCRGHIYTIMERDSKLGLNPEYSDETEDKEGYKHDEAYICTNEQGSKFKYYFDIDCEKLSL